MTRKQANVPGQLPPELRYRGVIQTHGDGRQNLINKAAFERSQKEKRAAIIGDSSKKSELMSRARQVAMMKRESKIKGDPVKYAEGWNATFGEASIDQLKAELARREAMPPAVLKKKRGRPFKVAPVAETREDEKLKRIYKSGIEKEKWRVEVPAIVKRGRGRPKKSKKTI